MKKRLFVMLIALLVGITSVNAMSKDELKNKLTSTYMINSAVFKLPQSHVVELERYLNSFELSSSDADYISNKIDEAIKVIEAGNARSFEELTKEERRKLSKLVSDISNSTSVKATIEGGNLVIYNPVTGGVFTKVTPVVKQTGIVNYVLITSGLLTLSGIVALVIKRGKNENA